MNDRRSARTPARAALGRGSSTPARSGAGRGTDRPSAFIRGSDGMRRTDEEIERNKQRAEERRSANNKPFRFFVPVGETRQVIVCDDKPDFFLYEHALKDSNGKWGRLFCGCIKEFDNCPVCKSTGKESYYAMVLTVIDLTPFRTRDGDDVEFSRKLLIVKPAQQKKFLRFFNKEGTLRGALFDMTRDGDKDSSIGNDIDFVEFVDEDEMETFVREYRDREGKRHTDACHEPYDYESIFDEPTMENLLALVGGEPTPGSRAADERELGGRGRGRDAPRRGRDADGWEDGDDRSGFGEGRGRGRGARTDADDGDDAPAAPARRAARGTARDDDQSEEAPRRSARRAAPVDEPDDDAPAPRRGRAAPADEDLDDAPAPRRARAGARPEADDEGGADDLPTRAPRTRRAAAEDEDAEPARPARRAARAPAPADDVPARPSRAARTARPARAAPAATDDLDDDDVPF